PDSSRQLDCQARPGRVVEWAVGDPGGGAGRGPAVADIVGMDGEVFVTEQQALLSSVLHGGAASMRFAVVTPGYRHTCLRPGKSPPLGTRFPRSPLPRVL